MAQAETLGSRTIRSDPSMQLPLDIQRDPSGRVILLVHETELHTWSGVELNAYGFPIGTWVYLPDTRRFKLGRRCK